MHISRLSAKMFLFGFAALAAIIFGLSLAGALLPRQSKSVRNTHFKAAPERLWAALIDVEGYPGWRPDVSRVQIRPSPDGRLVWREYGWYGSLTLRVEEAAPSKHLVTRVIASEVPFSAVWIFSLSPADDGGSMLHMQETREVNNPLYRLPVRIFIGGRASVDSYLRALGRKLGETVNP